GLFIAEATERAQQPRAQAQPRKRFEVGNVPVHVADAPGAGALRVGCWVGVVHVADIGRGLTAPLDGPARTDASGGEARCGSQPGHFVESRLLADSRAAAACPGRRRSAARPPPQRAEAPPRFGAGEPPRRVWL